MNDGDTKYEQHSAPAPSAPAPAPAPVSVTVDVPSSPGGGAAAASAAGVEMPALTTAATKAAVPTARKPAAAAAATPKQSAATPTGDHKQSAAAAAAPKKASPAPPLGTDLSASPAAAAAVVDWKYQTTTTDLLKRLQGGEKTGLEPKDYATALVHLYRGELARQTAYRQRLDQTTNWAVTLTVAMTGFSLSQPAISHWFHFVLVVFLVTIMFVEARRYRYYVVSQARVRLLEAGFYADVILSGSCRSPTGFNSKIIPPTAPATAAAAAAIEKKQSPAPPPPAPAAVSATTPLAASDELAYGPGAPTPTSTRAKGLRQRRSVRSSSSFDAANRGGGGGGSGLDGDEPTSPRSGLAKFFKDPPRPGGTWEQQLAISLHRPLSPISLLHSIVIRLRRMYIYLIGGCLCGWLVKLTVGDVYGDVLSAALIVPTFVIFLGTAAVLPFVYREDEEDV